MIKALFLDVDGTLISFETHQIPDSTREALLRAHERGVRLFIATGRAASDLEQLEGIPYEGVVALNGSDCVMRDGRVIARHLIPREDFEQAMELSDEYGFSLAFELDEGLFINRLSPAAEDWAELVAHPMPVETDLYKLYDNCECCQMCFFFDTETERRVMPQLPGLVSSRWSPIFVDVNVRGVNKATGMQAFLAHYGLSLAAAAAFGDGGNDTAMLRAAGVGIAMGNACDDALNAADYITSSVDDDGIARALKHFGIIE
ncbi:Cof-type HAD-IIB family hydrolase [uncultured Alistipes sp.]|jgi:cof-like hydrolase|uniref:Cof-type HAD-IIB family hydrolase n=1 Tax=uncultured Alistipes sp. TaxID=538949 RepID=UPI0025DF8EDB|nr:Cof-type HAD-IIB family hydrolase [uncultured Alistipes sp.]